MKLKLIECPECNKRTLMVRVRMNYVQSSGASEEWDAWYCMLCENTFKEKTRNELTLCVGGVLN